MDYIAKYGQIQTIQELYYIDGFTEDDVTLLKPFITLETIGQDNNKLSQSLFYFPSQRLLIRTQRVIEKQDGFLPKDTLTNSNHFTGDPWGIYSKYQIHFNNKVYAGLTAEKDPGEEFHGPRCGCDQGHRQ